MQEKLRPLMFVGTGSDVGKSIVNTGFCRIFKQDGYKPAPYKAQNMSLNSYATPEGLEIGRAQAVQAEACGIDCHTDMNPVLLKPTNDKSSQVVLNGRPVGNQTAKEYFLSNNKQGLFDEAYAAFQRLEAQYNPIVLEGAGSISELNLKSRDIVNMRMAIRTGADVILVSDIDRGGVFASVYGSIALLDEEERKHVKGVIINKFRGDIRLFEEGKQIIEDLTKVPVLGVIPVFQDIYIEDEDSVSLEKKHSAAKQDKVNVAVVLLGKLSNFTDFNALERDERVHLFYTRNPKEIEKADIVILPGSKNTISDLLEIRQNGVAGAVLRAYRNGKKLIGICGGYQMLGEWISDPDQLEGSVEEVPGLGVIPIRTEIQEEKQSVQTEFQFKNYTDTCRGYEIHMGRSIRSEECKALNQLPESETEGVYWNERCWGSYMHGILDNPVVINDLLSDFSLSETQESYEDFKERQYDLLADHMREHCDIPRIYENLKASPASKTKTT